MRRTIKAVVRAGGFVASAAYKAKRAMLLERNIARVRKVPRFF